MGKVTIIMVLIVLAAILCPLIFSADPSSPKNLFSTDQYTHTAGINTPDACLEYSWNIGYEPKYSRFWVWGILVNRGKKDRLARVRVTLIGDSTKEELVFEDTLVAEEEKQVVLFTPGKKELSTYNRCLITIEYSYNLLNKTFWHSPPKIDILETEGLKPLTRESPLNIQMLDLEY